MTQQKLFYFKIGTLLALVFVAGFIWYGVWRETNTGILTVAFLNVGQGDAIYIESPDHKQIIIDGGPGVAILSELSKVMPLYDRSIDALVITNPDKDHFAGFIDVLKRYKVSYLFESGTKTQTDVYKQLDTLAEQENLSETIVNRGMVIDLGSGVKLTILFPDHDVSGEKTNDGSIIARLTYGETSVMLTGDAPSMMEERVVELDQTSGDVETKSTVLKIGHHGSRTSASESFIAAVAPQYAIISAGKNNRYGHPHKETIDLLSRYSIPTFITGEAGTIVMKSDGKTFKVEYK